MGQPGKVSEDESPVLGVSPAHLHDASRTQLPSSVGFPGPPQTLCNALHKARFFGGHPRGHFVSPQICLSLSTAVTSVPHFSSLGRLNGMTGPLVSGNSGAQALES